MSDLKELLAKVEACKGPDRKIDAALALGLGIAKEEVRPSGLRLQTTSPPYTGSVDAAISLVEQLLPGWSWLVRSPDDGEGEYFCNLTRWDFLGKYDTVVVVGDTAHYSTSDPTEGGRAFPTWSKTPALALCAALLRALSNKETGGDNV